MRPHARNRATSPSANSLSCPPVPASFAVEQPTQSELKQRENIANARGVRIIESAWPSQPPRIQAYPQAMSGRGNYNSRRGGGDSYPTRNPNYRVMSFPESGQDEVLHNQPRPARGQTPLRVAAGRGRGVVDSIQPRTVPLLFNLPTEAERIAAYEVRRQEQIDQKNAKRGERRNKRLNKRLNNDFLDIHMASNYNTNNSDNEPSRNSEPLDNTGNMPEASGSRRTQPNRSSPPPPSPPPPPPPSHLSPPPPPPAPQYSLLMNESWRNWPEISVIVGPDLPVRFSTLDMYNLFDRYGEVEAVELFENTHGVRNGRGKVKFSRIYHPFWTAPVTYEWDNRLCRLQTQLLSLPKHKFLVASPTDKNKNYPDRFIFKPQKLDFGFMVEPNVMMAMYTTRDMDEITFEVNLFRKQIDVIFKIYLKKQGCTSGSKSPTSSKSKEDLMDEEKLESEQEGGKWESYRFRVPFAHLGKILEQGPVVSDTDRVFLISLPSPPLFWRKLHNVARSHEGGSYWTSWDMWFRQTGIDYNPQLRSCAPISLSQSVPIIIDTGRWTTYRFTFELKSSERFQEMLSALKDFNVNTEILDELRVTEDRTIPIWDSINTRTVPGSISSFSGDLSEAMTPLLPYPIRYQLEACISNNCLNEYNITTEFIDRLSQLPIAEAVSLLEHVTGGDRIYNPMDIFEFTSVPEGSAALKRKLPDDFQIVRKANITPSTVYYTTPTVERTNRVMRHYAAHSDRFLRVQFVDEKIQGRINSTDRRTMHEVFSRIMTAMDSGINIGDRHFEFLAFGNSQIRDHGAYFFASTDHLSTRDIRAWMGEFRDIKIVAKHAARLGQCFSTTLAIRGVQVDVQEIPDIEYPDNEYNFSDGVGKISDFLACLISVELKLPQDQPPPSCFQFRLGGCKGVLAVWPDAKKREVFIRPSQRKFQATHNILEVIRTSQFASASLNRQLIIVLSKLGTPDNVFILKLTQTLADFQDAMVNPASALRLLCTTVDPNQFTLDLAAIVRNKFMEFKDPFVISLLRLWRACSIKYLKEKAKITIEKGAFVLGVVDETGILKGHYDDDSDGDKRGGKATTPGLPEIFLQISDPDNPGEFKVIEELCIIARNPSLHPGDIRAVRAVNVPELNHLRNVVVFPSKGDRDLASMLSGGDLDGDDYIVIWDPDLTFGITNHKPMDFSPLEPRILDRDVTVPDITKFFVNYMRNDKLGAIANAHLAWADFHDDGVKSDQCLRLAALHSDAVDYVKTGEPAEMPRDLRRRMYPHFMEKEPDRTYPSHKILGQLYDLVVKIDFVPAYELQFDERILNAYTLNNELLEVAKKIKVEYDAALHRIMAQHEIHTEFEVYSTFVMHHSASSKDYKFHEEIGSIRNSLRDGFRSVVIQKVGRDEETQLGPFVAAMYTVTKLELDAGLEALEAKRSKGKRRTRPIEGVDLMFTPEDVSEMPLISFPWLFPEILGRLANREHPFINIDNTLNGHLGQSRYDHMPLPERGGTRTNGTRNTIYDFERGINTAADDLAGLKIIPAEGYPGDGSEAYMNFDYKEQVRESDGGMTRADISKNESHHHTSDGEANSGGDEVNDEVSSNRDILDEDEKVSFCEQLFRDMRPREEIPQI